MKPVPILSVCLLFLFAILAGCQPIQLMYTTPWVWKDATITLTPTGPGGTATIPGNVNLPGNQGCTRGAGAKPGCVRFGLNTIGTITFALAGQPAAQTCADAGVNRVITKVQLTDVDAGAGPSDKGNFNAASYPLPATMRDQGFPQLTISDGMVYEPASAADGVTRVTIINLNQNAAAAGVVDYWYKVTITHCTNGGIWETDPRMENEGRN